MHSCLARPAASALLPPILLPVSAPTNLASFGPVPRKIDNFLSPRTLRSCFGAGLRNNLPETLLSTPLSLRLGFPSSSRGLERVLRVGLSVVRAGRVEMASMGKLKREELQVYGTAEELTVSLAEHVAHVSAEAVKARGAFTVVLSGGSLIKMLGKLCEPPYLNSVDWARWHVFWADERVVKKDHPDSNYKLAWDGLLSKVPVPSGNVYAINDTLSTEAAAEDYESAIKQLTKTGVVAMTDGFPRFDLLLLGMGPDGHCCSLFPNHPLVLVKDKWIAPITDSPKPPPERITFTMPVVQAAANVTFVANGEGKAEMLAKVFGEELPLGQLPSQSARPLKGKLIWFADKAAASKL